MKPIKFTALTATALAVGLMVWAGYAHEGGHGHEAEAPAAADGAAKTYDFKDPKGVNGVSFFVNSKLEPFGGIGGGMSGTVSFDPENPKGFTGAISIDPKTLQVTNPRMTDVMHGDGWLNVENHDAITVTFDKVTNAAVAKDGSHVLTVDGKLKAMGLELDKQLIIRATHIADGGKARGGAESGDLLVLRSNFVVTRQDLGIKVDMGNDKVGNEIGIIVGVAGYEK